MTSTTASINPEIKWTIFLLTFSIVWCLWELSRRQIAENDNNFIAIFYHFTKPGGHCYSSFQFVNYKTKTIIYNFSIFHWNHQHGDNKFYRNIMWWKTPAEISTFNIGHLKKGRKINREGKGNSRQNRIYIISNCVPFFSHFLGRYIWCLWNFYAPVKSFFIECHLFLCCEHEKT